MSPDEAEPQRLHHLVEAFAHTAQPAEAFTRRTAGRSSVNDTAYSMVGDPAISERILEALVVTH